MIKRVGGGKFRLFTADGSRPLGPPTTRANCVEQEQAIKASQAARGKK